MSKPSGAPLPTLTVNGQFMSDFLEAATPCFALGLIEEGGKQTGFLALRPSETIPADVLALGFNLGHQLVGTSHFELVHFAFHFYGFKTYNALVNPSSPLVKEVLSKMVESKDYFFFALNPNRMASAYRSEIEEDNLVGLGRNLARIQDSRTTAKQYETALSKFEKKPTTPGTMLTWVCRDNVEYLDLTYDRLDLNGTAPTASNSQGSKRRTSNVKNQRQSKKERELGQEVNWQPLSQLPLVAHLIDEAVQDAERQHKLLREGRDKPHVFDDVLIARINRLYSEKQVFIKIYLEQIERWNKEKLSADEKQELARLAHQCQGLELLVASILTYAGEIGERMIDKIMNMDEAELALKFLLGDM